MLTLTEEAVVVVAQAVMSQSAESWLIGTSWPLPWFTPVRVSLQYCSFVLVGGLGCVCSVCCVCVCVCVCVCLCVVTDETTKPEGGPIPGNARAGDEPVALSREPR